MSGPLTLEALAAARGLPADVLRRLGWRDTTDGVAVPWPGGAVHVRHSLEREDGRPRWTWRDRALVSAPYGADRLPPDVAELVVVESEADAVALWSARVAAVATGGAKSWRPAWWGTVPSTVRRVIVWCEDAGSAPLAAAVLASRPENGPEVLVASPLWYGAEKDPGRILAARNGSGAAVLQEVAEHARPARAVAEEDLLEATVQELDGRWGTGGTSASARCPFHGDRDPSLSIYQAPDADGRSAWWWKCHGGSCGASGPLATLALALGLVPALSRSNNSAGPNLPPIGNPVGGLAAETLPEASGADLAAAGGDGLELPSLPLLGQEGFVIEGWSHLLAGYPRSGKTELLVRACREWLDLGRRVVYFTEEPRSIWQARLAALPGDWTNLRVVFALGADPDALMARAFGGREDIVILDTLRNLLRLRDEADNSEVARVLNPWVAKAREVGKTFIVAHHMRKGAGEHGEGIAGGHALLGSFDIALELLRDPQHPSRRIIRAYARLIAPPELAYERGEDGTFRALGDPAALRLEEVKARVLDVLTPEWQRTREVREALDEPRPGEEQVRRALLELAREGKAERDPVITLPASGRAVRWRILPEKPPTDLSYSGRLGPAESAAESTPFSAATRREAVLAALPTEPPGLTSDDVVGATGIPGQRVRELLLELAAADRVVRTGSGTRGDPYRYHRLETPEPERGEEFLATAVPEKYGPHAPSSSRTLEDSFLAREDPYRAPETNSAPEPDPPAPCPQCGRPLEKGVTCWRCQDRLCRDCGAWTGSPLRALCYPCGAKEEPP